VSDGADWGVKVRLKTRDQAKQLAAELRASGRRVGRLGRRVNVAARDASDAEEIVGATTRRYAGAQTEIRAD
jgi:hypothetical protein